ncbi:hypothetical protein DUI87_30124 [Hirundo rustica rustica]|uniref:Uncharacterized protein n=1 Tax=Hirundo rustica rustica TaxID=333673 RepID=A0A3M0J3N1_HIRRU|nr:hypothetical protein DUI87_30124 [Hirundo rustica rustica]
MVSGAALSVRAAGVRPGRERGTGGTGDPVREAAEPGRRLPAPLPSHRRVELNTLLEVNILVELSLQEVLMLPCKPGTSVLVQEQDGHGCHDGWAIGPRGREKKSPVVRLWCSPKPLTVVSERDEVSTFGEATALAPFYVFATSMCHPGG